MNFKLFLFNLWDKEVLILWKDIHLFLLLEQHKITVLEEMLEFVRHEHVSLFECLQYEAQEHDDEVATEEEIAVFNIFYKYFIFIIFNLLFSLFYS